MVLLETEALSLTISVVQANNTATHTITKGSTLYGTVRKTHFNGAIPKLDVSDLLLVHRCLSTLIQSTRTPTRSSLCHDRLIDICTIHKNTLQDLLSVLKDVEVGARHKIRDLAWEAVHTAWNTGKIKSISGALKVQLDRLMVIVRAHFRQLTPLSTSGGEMRLSEDLVEALEGIDLHHGFAQIRYLAGVLSYRVNLEQFGDIMCRVFIRIAEGCQTAILQQLKPTTSSDTFSEIKDPYANTFRWVFTGRENAVRPQHDLAHWLCGNQRLYLVGGKPVSGKSTLMKFVYKHPQTRKLLKPWCNGLPLVMTRAFPSTRSLQSQDTLRIMLATAIHTALVQQPGLTSVVFPKQWLEFLSNERNRFFCTENELVEAFRLLVKEDDRSIRLVCFIDGLHATSSNHAHVIEFWEDMLALSDFKLCLSSQCSVAFEDAFKHYPHLRLHDWTTDDIETYIRAQLSRCSSFSDLVMRHPSVAHNITQRIIGNSSGSFAWAISTVQTFVRLLSDGYRAHNPEECLNLIPDDLETFHLDTFNQLDPRYHYQASILFRLLGSSLNPVSTLELSYLSSSTGDIINMAVVPLSSDELRSRSDQWRYVNSRSNGLLEVSGSSRQSTVYGALDKGIMSGSRHFSMMDPNRAASKTIMRDSKISECLEYACFHLLRSSIWLLSSKDVTVFDGIAPTGLVLDYNNPDGVPNEVRDVVESLLRQLNNSRTGNTMPMHRKSNLSSANMWRTYHIEEICNIDANYHDVGNTMTGGYPLYVRKMLKKIGGHHGLPVFTTDLNTPPSVHNTSEVHAVDLPQVAMSGPENLSKHSVSTLNQLTDLRVILVRDSVFSENRENAKDVTYYTDIFNNSNGSLAVSDDGTTYRLPADYHITISNEKQSMNQSTLVDCGEQLVTYSHLTVKPFLELPAIKARLESMSPSIINIYEEHLKIRLAVLKTMKSSQRTLPNILKTIEHCIIYARMAEEFIGQPCTSLLDELDKVGQTMLSQYMSTSTPQPVRSATALDSATRNRRGYNRRRSNRHWASMIENFPWRANFLCLCVHSNLPNYVKTKLSSSNQIVDEAGESLLSYTFSKPASPPTFACEGLDPRMPNIRMALLLLEHNANPNHLYSGNTPWARLLSCVMEESHSYKKTSNSSTSSSASYEAYSRRMIAWAELVEAFLQHGANPFHAGKFKVVPTLRTAFATWDAAKALHLVKLASSKAWRLPRQMIAHPLRALAGRYT